jgi:hypothetical protein
MAAYETFSTGPRKGQPKTLTDRVVRFITEGLKQTELSSSSKKYRIFSGMNENNWLVGKAGAVRVKSKTFGSISITDKVHKMMQIWEKEL